MNLQVLVCTAFCHDVKITVILSFKYIEGLKIWLFCGTTSVWTSDRGVTLKVLNAKINFFLISFFLLCYLFSCSQLRKKTYIFEPYIVSNMEKDSHFKTVHKTIRILVAQSVSAVPKCQQGSEFCWLRATAGCET